MCCPFRCIDCTGSSLLPPCPVLIDSRRVPLRWDGQTRPQLFAGAPQCSSHRYIKPVVLRGWEKAEHSNVRKYQVPRLLCPPTLPQALLPLPRRAACQCHWAERVLLLSACPCGGRLTSSSQQPPVDTSSWFPPGCLSLPHHWPARETRGPKLHPLCGPSLWYRAGHPPANASPSPVLQ